MADWMVGPKADYSVVKWGAALVASKAALMVALMVACLADYLGDQSVEYLGYSTADDSAVQLVGDLADK